MNENVTPEVPAAASAPTGAPRGTASPAGSTAERTGWWITFSVLTIALVLMLGLWN